MSDYSNAYAETRMAYAGKFLADPIGPPKAGFSGY